MIEALCPNCGKTVVADRDKLGSLTVCDACASECYVPSERVHPGQTFGNYEIIRPLGIGATGEVHLARDRQTNRQAALKIMFADSIEKEEDLQRFLRESRNAANLQHPGIVHIFATGKHADCYYLAMEYIEGETLEKMLAKHGALEEKDALGIVREVAAALGYAWEEKRLLHRDIKPANIMLAYDGRAKIMDLGIAKSLLPDVTKLTDADTIIGTPFYMSPEQCAPAKPIDCRSDIYSLGATLYHLLTEEVPFLGRDTMEVIRKHMFDAVPNPKLLNPDLSDACVSLIFRMMSKSAQSRHASWPALIEEVDAALATSA